MCQWALNSSKTQESCSCEQTHTHTHAQIHTHTHTHTHIYKHTRMSPGMPMRVSQLTPVLRTQHVCHVCAMYAVTSPPRVLTQRWHWAVWRPWSNSLGAAGQSFAPFTRWGRTHLSPHTCQHTACLRLRLAYCRARGSNKVQAAIEGCQVLLVAQTCSRE